MMSTAIEIPIYHHTDETSAKEAQGLDTFVNEYEIRYWEFFQIDAVGDYIEGKEEYGKIFSSGTFFISPYPKKKLQRMIEEHINRFLPSILS